MDPNANLKEQRELVKKLRGDTSTYDDAIRLTELVEALDEWIRNGGALPSDWVR